MADQDKGKVDTIDNTTLNTIVDLHHQGQEADGDWNGHITAAQIYKQVTGNDKVIRTSPEYKGILTDIAGLIEEGCVKSKKTSAGMVYTFHPDKVAANGKAYVGKGNFKKVDDPPAKAKKPPAKKTSKAKKKKTTASKATKTVAKERPPEKLKRKIRKTIVIEVNNEVETVNLSKTILATVKAVCEQFDAGCTIGLLCLGLEQQGVVVDKSFTGKGIQKVKGQWTTSRTKLSSQLAWHKSKGNLTGDRGHYVYVEQPE